MASGWKYAAASVIGTSHLKSPNGICQASHQCVYDYEADRLICVVSDGAGSASRSDRGSRNACDLVVDLISKVDGAVLHARNFALDVVCSVKKALEVEAEQEECAVRDFACTLRVAVVDQQRATFWQIGDGDCPEPSIRCRQRRDESSEEKISRTPRSRLRRPHQRAPWSAVEELFPNNLKGEYTHA